MPHVYQYKRLGTFEDTGSDASAEMLAVHDQYVSDGKITNVSIDSDNVVRIEFSTSANCDSYLDEMGTLNAFDTSGHLREQGTQTRYDT
mgnify:CR=1 FL=1|tara:strand:+ start:149 stop:415 length:267 start_codon:yes stop_codon:yes gene_type:complete